MKIKSFLERKENIKKKLVKQMNANSDLIRKIGVKFSVLDCRKLTEDRKEFQAPKTRNVLEDLDRLSERQFTSNGLPLKMTRASRHQKKMYEEDPSTRERTSNQSNPRNQSETHQKSSRRTRATRGRRKTQKGRRTSRKTRSTSCRSPSSTTSICTTSDLF